MTVAIKRANGDLLWFDAVLDFSRRYSSTVTKHPVETGAFISDHIITDNPVLIINGVLTDADFNVSRPQITEAMVERFGVNRKEFVNKTEVTQLAQIKEGSSPLARLLPEVAAQFFDEQAPEVIVTPNPKNKPALTVAADLEMMWKTKEVFEVLDLVAKNQLREPYRNCVITSLSFAEDPDAGDAVWPVMQIEQVTFATSESVQLAKATAPSVQKQAAKKENKGRETPLEVAKPTEEGDKPQAEKKATSVVLGTYTGDENRAQQEGE